MMPRSGTLALGAAACGVPVIILAAGYAALAWLMVGLGDALGAATVVIGAFGASP